MTPAYFGIVFFPLTTFIIDDERQGHCRNFIYGASGLGKKKEHRRKLLFSWKSSLHAMKLQAYMLNYTKHILIAGLYIYL